jgi:hypothetical protein
MKLTWKHALIALSVVTVTLGAAGCKKADTSADATAGSSAPAATDSAMTASGAAAASGASQ